MAFTCCCRSCKAIASWPDTGAQARLQMATGDFAGAARTLETCFSLGHDLSKAPTLIHGLVGHRYRNDRVEPD